MFQLAPPRTCHIKIQFLPNLLTICKNATRYMFIKDIYNIKCINWLHKLYIYKFMNNLKKCCFNKKKMKKNNPTLSLNIWNLEKARSLIFVLSDSLTIGDTRMATIIMEINIYYEDFFKMVKRSNLPHRSNMPHPPLY